MITYTLSYQNPNNHFLDIEVIFDNINDDTITLQLPAWRPGRYELGNFAKNIQKFAVLDLDNNPVVFQKNSKDSWLIQTKEVSGIKIKYNYYAAELNAGSTYLTPSQLYVNPVNCFIYDVNRQNEECEVILELPEDYKVATGMPVLGKHTLMAKNTQQLLDSPFITSNSLQHNSFLVDGVNFHVWFQGEIKPDWETIIKDFKAFTTVQIKAFGDFPEAEYHYLVQITPYKHYHGVEHENSTVISLGPSYEVMDRKGMYLDFLGVSSHELYHTWNVKKIRPLEMMPYDFSKENYSKLGYVTEGITTYYGDQMLLRSKVLTEKEYWDIINNNFEKHFNNHGRFNMSVADSSFDTWLDGYVKGIPNRKVSIYNEGAIIAFILDIEIMRATNNLKSLDDVMTDLWLNFGQKEKGYTEEDYFNSINTISGKDFKSIFSDLYNGTSDTLPYIQEALYYIGSTLEQVPSKNIEESKLGIQLNNGIISNVFPNSLAENIGLWNGDKVLSINSFEIKNDFSKWLKYFKNDDIDLTISRANELIHLAFKLDQNKDYYLKYSVKTNSNNDNYKQWAYRNC